MADLRVWTRTEDQLPPEGEVVVVLNGHVEVLLALDGGLWWFPDRSMYVYFWPKLWRPLG